MAGFEPVCVMCPARHLHNFLNVSVRIMAIALINFVDLPTFGNCK